MLLFRFVQRNTVVSAGAHIRSMCAGSCLRKSPSLSSRDRFEGCLLGALVGDCLGSIFECKYWQGIAEEVVTAKLDPHGRGMMRRAKESMKYTDDTAMTRSICSSLLECDGLDPVHLAMKFSQSFAVEPNRGFGSAAFQLLSTWQLDHATAVNVYDHARRMFDGAGSYGNGGAMRVAPVALYARSEEDVVDLAVTSARLTHTHRLGYVGAALQALAVYQALTAAATIDPKVFLDSLKFGLRLVDERDKTRCLNTDETAGDSSCASSNESDDACYAEKLKNIEDFLTAYALGAEDDVEAVIKKLGNGVNAVEAVPAAIYSFLRTLNLGFEECLYYSIRLGGDTDTIASMSCAIAGAYYGKVDIPSKWLDVSEGSRDAMLFAERLFLRRWGKGSL